MGDERDSEALAALLVLAARLRDTAAAVAERADAAANGVLGAEEGARTTDENAWASADFGALIDLFKMVGDSVPDKLRRRLDGSSREALTALRALIDWYLERGADGGESSQPGDQPTAS